MKLTIMTFNIRHGLGIDGRQQLSRIIEQIRSSEADIVALQEVDRHFASRSGWADQPALLGEALGMFVAYGASLDLEPSPESEGHRRQYGIAILSKRPFDMYRCHRLPSGSDTATGAEPRGLLEAHIRIGKQPVRVFNTHFGLTRPERLAQARFVLDHIGGQPSRCMLTGDFNAEPDSGEIRLLRERLNDAYAAANGDSHQATLLSPDGPPLSLAVTPTAVSCIDYVFVSADIRPVGAVVPWTTASDHLPIVCELELD